MRAASTLALLLALRVSRADYLITTAASGILSSKDALFSSLLAASALGTRLPGIDPAKPACAARAAYAAQLSALSPRWAVKYGAEEKLDTLAANWTAADFRQAFLFMSGVAVLADVNNHHPLWTNVYNSISATLNTDDKPCLSDLDFSLARGMDAVWALVLAPAPAPAAAATPFLKTPAGIAAVAAPCAALALALAALAVARWRAAAAAGAAAKAPFIPGGLYGTAGGNIEDNPYSYKN